MKLKLILSVLVASGTIHATAIRSVAAEPLSLSNPGFEDQLNAWDTHEDGGMSKVTAEAAHTGKFGLRVTDDSEQTGSGICSQTIPVSAGKTYQVLFWSRTISGVGAGVYLRFLGADGKVIVPATENQKVADRAPVVEAAKIPSDWSQMSGTKSAPDGAVAVTIYIHSYSKHTITVDFDDFVLSESSK